MSRRTDHLCREEATEPRRQLMDVAQAAAYLTTTERHIRRLVNERRLTFHKVGPKLRFKPDDLDAWLEANRVEASR